jgi:hypothetical protein
MWLRLPQGKREVRGFFFLERSIVSAGWFDEFK